MLNVGSMGPQQRNTGRWRGGTAAGSVIEGGEGVTTKGSPREHARENARENARERTRENPREHPREHAREPIDIAIPPFSPSLID
jgi:hypothetical protein